MFTISPISQSRFAREQLNRTHFAQIHAHWIVGAFGRLLGLGLGRDLLLHLDELAALALGLLVGLLARLFAFFARLLGQQRAVRRGLGPLSLPKTRSARIDGVVLSENSIRPGFAS